MRRIQAILAAGLLAGVAVPAPAFPTNVWLGGTAAWEAPANWSAGAPPAADRPEDAFIPPSASPPVLSADAAVGGSLAIGKGARLSLQGRRLRVGSAYETWKPEPDLMDLADRGAGLVLEPGSLLVPGEGGAITIAAGGLRNDGAIQGPLRLAIEGRMQGFRIRGASTLELSSLETAFSPFPYEVHVSAPVRVRGNLELAGGNLVAESPSFAVEGDLVFKGSRPGASVVPEKDIRVSGTIRSGGSAACPARAEGTPVWNREAGAADDRPTGQEGWVWLVGSSNRTLTAGGILPPIGLDTKGGVVAVEGDLHSQGLQVQPGSVLDLSRGQRLVFGSFERDWTANPELNGQPPYGPIRGCRDLINLGTIKGTPGVPVAFHVNDGAARRIVEGVYEMQEAATGADDTLSKALPWQAHGSLSINRYDSRLRLRDGRLTLDGEPAAFGPAKAADPLAALDGGAAKATFTKLTVTPAPPESPAMTWANAAPFAASISASLRDPVVLAVNGPLWGRRDIYGLVDGDPALGYSGSAAYDVIFPEAIPVHAVRITSDSPLPAACRFAVMGDTTGSGRCDRVLGSAQGGLALASNAMDWGIAEAAFPTQRVHRLRLAFFTRDGKPAKPDIGEVEIGSDADSLNRLKRQAWVSQIRPFPDDVPFLETKEPVEAVWPEPAPEDRVRKAVVAAFWMFGLGWGETTDTNTWAALPRLKDHPPCTRVLDEMKNRYGHEVILLFFEGEKVGVPWPSVKFKSATNARYLTERAAALKAGALMKPTPAVDDLAAILEGEPDAGKGGPVPDPAARYREPLTLRDLPCQRNLMTELCEAAHERGMKVYVICRPEDVEGPGSLYTGPAGDDPYAAFIGECVAGGADGASVVPDEAHLLWSTGNSPRWKAFEERRKAARPAPGSAEDRALVLERDQLAGKLLAERMAAVREIRPDAAFYTGGARMLHGGDPYDTIGRLINADYLGCAYQSHLVRRWAAAARDRRKVYMFDYVSRTVRFSLESLLQGARMIGDYRYNYIALAGSEDAREREGRFIRQFVAMGGTRPGRPAVALVVSRASEAWWPVDCRTNPALAGKGHLAWGASDALYAFLLRNGYPFDVFYLDQPADLAALRDYRLIVLPFPYSVQREALAPLEAAVGAGASLLVAGSRGEVDETGRRYEPPLLAGLIGLHPDRTAFLDRDLLEWENERDYVPALSALVDRLLGPAKEIRLERYGNRIEAFHTAVRPDERYLSFINWEDREAAFEAGLSLPVGRYKALVLSSASPEATRAATLGGKPEFPSSDLARFALRLRAGEVVSLYIVPAGRAWGERPLKPEERP